MEISKKSDASDFGTRAQTGISGEDLNVEVYFRGAQKGSLGLGVGKRNFVGWDPWWLNWHCTLASGPSASLVTPVPVVITLECLETTRSFLVSISWSKSFLRVSIPIPVTLERSGDWSFHSHWACPPSSSFSCSGRTDTQAGVSPQGELLVQPVFLCGEEGSLRPPSLLKTGSEGVIRL